MQEYYLNAPSETDWERLENLTDDEVDLSDIPPIEPAFWENAPKVKSKTQKQVLLPIDADVLAWFKAQGKEYQTQINRILRNHMEAHPPR
jgi:uncharacterized protein (DUF4415 family)